MAESFNSSPKFSLKTRILAGVGAVLTAGSLVGCEMQATAEKPRKAQPVTIQKPIHDGVVVAQNVNVRSTPKVINKSPEHPGRDDNIMYEVEDERLFLLRPEVTDVDKRKGSADYWLKFKDENGKIGFIALTQLAYQEDDLDTNYTTVYSFSKKAALSAEHQKLQVAPGITEDVLKTTDGAFTIPADEELATASLLDKQEVSAELKDLGLR